MVIELYRKVTVICSNHAAVVNSSADFTHFFFDFVFVLHLFSSLGFPKHFVLCCFFLNITTQSHSSQHISMLVFIGFRLFHTEVHLHPLSRIPVSRDFLHNPRNPPSRSACIPQGEAPVPPLQHPRVYHGSW